MSVKELVKDLENLNASELQEVATYVSFLKFRARHPVAPSLPGSADLAQLYAEFSDEDRQSEKNYFRSGVEKTANVIGGDACIVGTRIPVWALEGYRRLGWREAQILENYPTLRAADLVNAWAYVATHPEEIDQALREQEEA